MITEAILNGFYSVITFLLGLLPDIPQLSEDITNGLTTIIDIIGETVGAVAYLYTPPVLIAVFTIIIVIINFEIIYKFGLWVYHKLRG